MTYGCPLCNFTDTNATRMRNHREKSHKIPRDTPLLLLPPSPSASSTGAGGAPNPTPDGQGALKEIPLYTNDELTKKRQQIESLKLDKELTALQSPNTNMDMFKQMLELQSNNFNQQLQMQSKLTELSVKLAEVQAGGGTDSNDELIKALLPMLPELLRAKAAAPQKKKEVEEVKKPSEEEINKYKLKIRAGEIPYEQFVKDSKAIPQLAKLPKATLKDMYSKIKEGKL